MLASRQQTTTNQRIISNQTQRRPAVDSWTSLLPTVGPPEAAGELLCCALQSDARHAAGVAEASEAVQPCPKGVPGFVTVSRHEGVPAQSNPRCSPIAVPKIFVTRLLAPGRRLEVGTGHELAGLAFVVGTIWGGNPGSLASGPDAVRVVS